MENNVTAWLITLLTRQSSSQCSLQYNYNIIQSFKAREKLAVFLCWMCYILCVSIFEIRKNTGMERIAFIFREKTFLHVYMDIIAMNMEDGVKFYPLKIEKWNTDADKARLVASNGLSRSVS